MKIRSRKKFRKLHQSGRAWRKQSKRETRQKKQYQRKRTEKPLGKKLFKKQVMRLSCTLDHRLLDGSVVAKFEMDLRDLLEKPMSILL